MAQPSLAELIYLYGVVVAFAAFTITLLSVSVSTSLARPGAAAG